MGPAERGQLNCWTFVAAESNLILVQIRFGIAYFENPVLTHVIDITFFMYIYIFDLFVALVHDCDRSWMYMICCVI